MTEKPQPTNKLHIFVNRRKFDENDGVKEQMTGAEIAWLVEIPRDAAVVKREHGQTLEDVPLDDPIEVKNGDHFVAVRSHVDGGHDS